MSLSVAHSSGSHLLDVEVAPRQEDRTAKGRNSENGTPKDWDPRCLAGKLYVRRAKSPVSTS